MTNRMTVLLAAVLIGSFVQVQAQGEKVKPESPEVVTATVRGYDVTNHVLYVKIDQGKPMSFTLTPEDQKTHLNFKTGQTIKAAYQRKVVDVQPGIKQEAGKRAATASPGKPESPRTMSGIVESVDAKANVLTVNEGPFVLRFDLDKESGKANTLKNGDPVTITFTETVTLVE